MYFALITGGLCTLSVLFQVLVRCMAVVYSSPSPLSAADYAAIIRGDWVMRGTTCYWSAYYSAKQAAALGFWLRLGL